MFLRDGKAVRLFCFFKHGFYGIERIRTDFLLMRRFACWNQWGQVIFRESCAIYFQVGGVFLT